MIFNLEQRLRNDLELNKSYDGLLPPEAVVLIKEPGAGVERHLLAQARRGQRKGRSRGQRAREGEEDDKEGRCVHFEALELPLLPAFRYELKSTYSSYHTFV